MRWTILARCLPLALSLSLAGCPLTDDTETPGGGLTDGGLPVTGWALRPHPCPGRTTEALHAGEDGQIYVGCGTGAEGTGLWRTENLGVTWAPVPGLEDWRVNDVDPAPDGGLFVAGIHTTSRAVVTHLGADGRLSTVYERGVVVSSSFHVGHFGRLASGVALAESLTGTPVVHRDRDDVLFQPLDVWSSDAVSHQILAMVEDDEAFYAVGSTITEPPLIFLPTGSGQTGVPLFTPVAPLPQVQGELWGLAVDGGRLLAVGVDQDADRGVVLVGPTDGFNPQAWAAPDVAALVEGSSWFRGACMRGDHLVVLGESQPWRRGGGLVFESFDGGETWTPAAPESEAQAWHRCEIRPDGTLILAGVNGSFAVRAP
ncbi:MAG: hypothetical protein H6702_18495 [Myxococcales bacterium]|nr:hypothetical protein [Myxococcales bacterium]